MRRFYAIEYAYGRTVVNDGQRADHIHVFTSKGARTAFLDERERAGVDADALPATNPLVKRALRYNHQGIAWPVPVASGA